MSDVEQWYPDHALVFAIRARQIPIAPLDGPDRAWIVAALTVHGWTVASIADRLKCSLRLVQQIKAEPLTKVALYALQQEKEVLEQKALRHLEASQHRAEVAEMQATIQRLERHRDMFLDRLTQLTKESKHARS